MKQKHLEAPLCICGKPRKQAKHYVCETESYFYKTCGDTGCRKSRVPVKVGSKPVFKPLRQKNDPTRICHAPDCNKPVGESKYLYQKLYCSIECRQSVTKKTHSKMLRAELIKRDRKRAFLSEVYADLKAGATKLDIRRKYFLDSVSLDEVIRMAITNRERELTQQKEANARLD